MFTAFITVKYIIQLLYSVLKYYCLCDAIAMNVYQIPYYIFCLNKLIIEYLLYFSILKYIVT